MNQIKTGLKKMNLEIKTSLPDSGKIWNLFLTTGWNDEYGITEEEYYKTIIESRFIVTVYEDEKLVGCGRVICDGILHAMIYDLIVLPDYQGAGIGTMILDKLIELCKKSYIRDIQLFSAKGKKSYYEKRGFIVRPDDGPGMELGKTAN
jgi:N-acetylglutamate synthase-like GNAT family acetyltransferase